MSKIDELINSHPVEWKYLSEIGDIYGGLSGKTKEDFTHGDAKYVTYKNVFDNLAIDVSQLETVYVGEEEKQRTLRVGDIIFTGSSETPDECGMSSVVEHNLEEKVYLNSFCFFLRPNRDDILYPGFSKYLFRGTYFRKQMVKVSNGVTRFNVSKKLMKKVSIPVPNYDIQIEIAKILDKFTDYVNELKAELKARVNQYAYYRDYLLSEEVLNKLTLKMDVDRSIRATTLGEIGKVSMCKRILKNQTSMDGDIPFYKIGTFGKKPDAFINRGLYEEYREKYSYPKKGDVLLSASGTIGKEVIYDGEDAYYQDSNIIWIANDEKIVKNKYLYYFYQTEPWKATTGGTIARLYGSTLSQTNITVPSLEVQNIVIKILDKFQSLIEDTKGLLPEKIEQRQKQYEYYRDKLLTFEPEYSSKQASKQASKQVTDDYIELLFEAAKLVKVSLGVFEYKLKDVTVQPKEKISVNDLDSNNYVGVENLLQDKKGKTTAASIPKEGNVTQYLINDILIGNIRPYLKKIWQANNNGGTNGDVVVIRKQEEFKEKIQDRFLFHILSSEKFFEYDMKYAKGAKMPRGDKKQIMNYQFYLPPLNVQNYVVSVLDKFETLVHGVEDSLPREIELRQKQYEYYRDKLLDFSK